ncbi:4-hydroxy-tetrahydrodipicolinate reductase [Wolbachia pipientis]|uniref:4-hydroxy-tetrahydrodipicolinate reductase n=1 Tax=Wolbachia pipientis TaxID=955 RepID=A0A1E7QKG2_WOLPI|nr:4-hydroxy-tetrahydrodipicolinate reductase [Wolbachia pipientis]OEY86965.1 4-hydroxy-tetrahydrodipicolinate reductase [Wolbachia pipientis]
MKIKIGIIGCLGKMGKAIIQEVVAHDKTEIVAAVARSNIGEDYRGVKITDSISDAFKISDIVIDFTVRESMIECLDAAVEFKKPLVSGTTGIEDMDLYKYSSKVPILWSANMSVGVNILLKLVKEAAELLGGEYDVEIWEMHHNLKKDSPSGTAIELGKTIAETLKIDFCINRQFPTIRQKGNIGFAVSRGGGVIGDHNVMFVNSDERVELSHKVINREVFAKGAVKAAIWLYENKRNSPGLYSMQEVI